MTGASTYWEYDERMKALKEMLTCEHDMDGSNVDWMDRTRYMELSEFKNQPALPVPSEVVQRP